MAYSTVDEKKKQEQQVTAAPKLTESTGQYSYNADNNQQYQNAWNALQQAQNNKPVYNNSYAGQLDDLYKRITNRDKFTYDVNEDALYQQYKDQYVKMGQLAMKDTMGQAAALTGGYGSSYGQSVGQQQYNAYLQNLNDVVPELYGMAYQQYQDQGDALMNQYNMVGKLADDEYGKYQDALNQYWQNVSHLQGQTDDAYDRGYENWYNELMMQQKADETKYQREQDAYAKQQDAYGNLVDMITTLGYTPTADELAAAGMSDAQYKAYYSYYKKMNPDPVAVSYGGYSGGGGGGTTNRYEEVKKNAEDDDASGTVSNATIIGDIAAAYMDGLITKAQAAELEAKYNKPYLNI